MTERLIERVERIATLDPSRQALCDADGRSYCYGELLYQAKCCAAWLQGEGLGPQTVLGIACAQDARFVIALLGAWWAGCVPMLLDIRQPAQRLQEIQSLAELPFTLSGTAIDALDQDRASEVIAPPSTLDDLAYVVCSSGSSGRPKLVEVTHRGLLPVLDAQIDAWGIDAEAHVLWALAPGFDASLSDIGTALAAGACLHIHPTAILSQPERLLACLRDERISHADLPPALLPRLDPSRLPATLRCVVIGGEVADSEAVRAWSQRVQLFSVYGPSEATICTSMARADAQWQRPLIGQPIAGARYRIDPASGDPRYGELWIGGQVLAKGYRDAEMTADRFVVDDEGQRWYRSGDVVRRDDDGEWLFCGRVDRQHKRHGQLVAPEEVEAVLRHHPAIREAAVLQRPEGLVAFLVGEQGSLPSGDMAYWCHEHLPTGLRPDRLLWAEALPRLANQKCDYQALGRLPLEDREGTAPRPGIEQRLADVWRRVLPLAGSPLRESDFFAEGGDSFALMHLLAEAELAGLQLSAEVVHRHRRLAAIAVHSGDDRMSHIALKQEVDRLLATLPPSRQDALAASPSTASATSDKALLLTGATGFLGMHLLECLQQEGQGPIILLLRGNDEQAARDRLERQRDAFGCQLSLHDVEIICGDVAEPCLGLSPTAYQALGERVKHIVHCAGQVSVTADYQSLYGPHVLAMVHLLTLARNFAINQIDYASTLSVQVSAAHATGVLYEADTLGSGAWVHGGYAQSKWVAEVLLSSAHPEARCYRLGLLTPHRCRQALPRNDLLSALVRGLDALGAVPREAEDCSFDWTPVDYAAAMMAAGCQSAQRGTAHRFEPEGEAGTVSGVLAVSAGSVRCADLVEALAAERGSLRQLSYERWQQAVAKAPLAPWLKSALLLGFSRLDGADHFARQSSRELFKTSSCSFDDRRAAQLRQYAGIERPQIDQAIVRGAVAAMLTNEVLL